MRIKDLCKEVHSIAKDHGFWKRKNIPEKIMLIVTELSEAVEALRKNNRQSNAIYSYKNGDCVCNKTLIKTRWVKDTVEDELSDAVIRIADLCEYMNVDLEWQLKNKIKFNKQREKMHGKKF